LAKEKKKKKWERFQRRRRWNPHREKKLGNWLISKKRVEEPDIIIQLRGGGTKENSGKGGVQSKELPKKPGGKKKIDKRGEMARRGGEEVLSSREKHPLLEKI